ncbi:MAG TPA: SUMF1/EgtB/PvdO family nonheme iron enzyme [Solirubrobacteraceae bacterium]|jgi:iron(II)-dependent oxidoreductase|nr:SUMF1/EgtB/PvdO family nonheme iron enzyme [Solirubrobacteraceae bacterium]
MAIDARESRPVSAGVAEVLDGLEHARAATLALVAPLDDEQLQRLYSPIMSPLVWDLGHIAAYEDLWLAHRLGGRELLRPDLAALYDAFETPRAVRGELELLAPAQARRYLEDVRARTSEALERCGVGDGAICEMVIRHELQHGETMRQTLAIAGLLSSTDAAARDRPIETGTADRPASAPGTDDADDAGQEWVVLGAGTFELGAPDGDFSYDNERPRHRAETDAFEIARRPASNGELVRFAEDGGYEREELWSPDGWAWRTEQEPAQHPAIAAGHPDAPACHLSWYEADAFARSSDARLPSEAEWERAATSAPLAAIGRVWEWTGSFFGGYPDFVAYPYREYSEVFFGKRYRVLRGSSWATDARVASRHFRNWDLPLRRQIFAGVRLARDLD